MAKACSRILVTVATLDKRAYKYIAEKHSGLHSALDKLLSRARPIPAHQDQIYMHRGDFVGFAGTNDRNNVLHVNTEKALMWGLNTDFTGQYLLKEIEAFTP